MANIIVDIETLYYLVRLILFLLVLGTMHRVIHLRLRYRIGSCAIVCFTSTFVSLAEFFRVLDVQSFKLKSSATYRVEEHAWYRTRRIGLRVVIFPFYESLAPSTPYHRLLLFRLGHLDINT